MKLKRLGILGVPMLASIMQPSVVLAEKEGLVLEEILVSARKREESAQDVPVAIQAFQTSVIERYGATNLTEIGDLATQVTVFPNAAGNGANITIRGYGSDSLDPGIEASVGINLDGVQIDRGAISRQAFFDLQSVEVLKGPQALFFGKNSPAGVISLNSALPTGEFEAKASVGYEFEAEEKIFDGVISGPLSDTVLARFAVRYSDSNGSFENRGRFVENSAGEVFAFPFDFPGGVSKLGAEESLAGRLTLDWQPTDNFGAVARLLVTDFESNGFRINEFSNCTGPLPTSNTVLGPIVDTSGDCRVDGVVSQGRLPAELAAAFSRDIGDGSPRGEFESILASVNLQWELDWGTLSSVTGFYDYDFFRFDNFDSTNFFQLPSLGVEDQKQITQEFRLQTSLDQPVNYMVGVYAETFDRNVDSAATIFALPFGPLLPPGVGPDGFFTNTFESESEVESDSFSVFGQVIWNITDQWELTAGARFTKDDKEATQQYVYVHPFVGGDAGLFGQQQVLLAANTPLDSEFDDENISPEVTLTWRPEDNITVWGAYRTGYKSGGFSTNTIISASADGESLTFEPEEAEGFEFGVKSILLDGRLKLNATAYRYEFDDQQIGLFDSATVSLSVRNIASGTTTGFELESEYIIDSNLSVSFQLGYNEGEYDEYRDAPCFTGQTLAQGCIPSTIPGADPQQDLSGSPLIRAPELQGAIGLDYQQDLSNRWALLMSGEVNYTDEYQASTNANPLGLQDSFARINARVSLLSDDGKYEFSLIGRNLSDEIIFSTSNDAPGSTTGLDLTATPVRGRQIILEAKYAL